MNAGITVSEKELSKKEKNETKTKPQATEKDTSITPADAPLVKLYDSLKGKNGFLDVAKFVQKLWEYGIHINDYPSLKDARVTVFTNDKCTDPLKLDLPMFLKAVRPIKDVILNAFHGKLAIPDFPKFCRTLQLLCEAVKLDKRGVPVRQLDYHLRAHDIWAVSICSIDGQKWGYGQIDHPFTLQGCCTPLLYALAMEYVGPDEARRYVGYEHSVVGMTPFSTDQLDRPLNPLTKAGAITLCSLIQSLGPDRIGQAEMFRAVLGFIKKLTGGANAEFNNSAYLTEIETVSINKSLKCFLQSSENPPRGADIDAALNIYQQVSSIQVDTKSLSVIAGTLANDGVNPLTKKRVLFQNSAKHLLSVMSNSGMYNYSGPYLMEVGIPSKASRTGIIMGVVPGLFGIALYSPKVNMHDISVRGYTFMHSLSQAFYFHKYEPPYLMRSVVPEIEDKKCTSNCFLFRVVADGDLLMLTRFIDCGYSIHSKDLMRRNLLHAAVQHKQADIVNFLTALFPELVDEKDNMGQTPYDDAHFFKDPEVIRVLTFWDTIRNGGRENTEIFLLN